MRNLLEYPITADEVKKTVEHAAEAHRALGYVGSLDGIIWHSILKTLNTQAFMDLVLEEANGILIKSR